MSQKEVKADCCMSCKEQFHPDEDVIVTCLLCGIPCHDDEECTQDIFPDCNWLEGGLKMTCFDCLDRILKLYLKEHSICKKETKS
jgi:hypothetical protein